MTIGGTQYEVILRSVDGQRLATLDDYIAFTYTRVLGNLGPWTVDMPAHFDINLIAKDRRIEIFRKPVGGAMRRDFSGYILLWQFERDDAGNEMKTIGGFDEMHQAARRIIAYQASTAESQKTDFADDMMKTIVRENLGASALGSRNITSWGLSVASDAGLGPTLTKSFSRQNLLDVLRRIMEASKEAGTETFFGFQRTADSTLVFNTAINQPGIDRTEGIGNPIIFSKEFDNLGRSIFIVDYRDYANVVYAGGQGEEIGREIYVAEDSAEVNTPIAYTEKFVDARNENEYSGVQDAARTGLVEHRALRRYEAQIKSVPGSEYGIDWDVGYRVTAHDYGMSFDCLIRAVTVERLPSGEEKITATLEHTA